MTMSKPLIDTKICKSWQEQWKRSSTTFERMLVTFSSVFQLFILYANFCYFTRTLKNDLGRWKNFVVFITDFYYTIYIKENLKKWKNYFPQSKVTTHCSLHPVVNWFGIWGKRSHWPRGGNWGLSTKEWNLLWKGQKMTLIPDANNTFQLIHHTSGG